MKNAFTKIISHALLAMFCLLGSSLGWSETKITYLHNDLLGSPLVATDEQGQVAWRKSYGPFGVEETFEGQATRETGVGYTGHASDKATGLVYMGARYYNPQTGVFLSRDPASVSANDPFSFNRYSYVNNNPYRYIDPDGRNPVVAGVIVGVSAFIFSEYANTPRKEGDIHSRTFLERLTAITPPARAGGIVARQAAKEGVDSVAKSADDIFKAGRTPKASELQKYAEGQGWKPTQTEGGPLKYVDENGIPRVTIKQGSSRAPGSGSPHVELKDASGQRIDPSGNPVTRKSPGNHTPIDYDL